MMIAESKGIRLLTVYGLLLFSLILSSCGSTTASDDTELSSFILGAGLNGISPAGDSEADGTSNTPLFIDAGDGTVVSTADSLMWAKCQQSTGSTNLYAGSEFCSGTRGEFQFCDQNGDCNGNGAQGKITPPYTNGANSPAYASCDGLVLGGTSDWRLPTRTELARFFYNLYLNDTTAPSVFPNAYRSGAPDAVNNFNWSTTGTGDSTNAWAMSGFNGEITSRAQSNTYYVRCVRDNI